MANENINEANVNENAEVVEEVITEETAQTVEEVTEASEPQGPYAALGGTVSDQKIPRINKNKVKFGIYLCLISIFLFTEQSSAHQMLWQFNCRVVQISVLRIKFAP